MAIDAATGVPCPDFGKSGQVSLRDVSGYYAGWVGSESTVRRARDPALCRRPDMVPAGVNYRAEATGQAGRLGAADSLGPNGRTSPATGAGGMRLQDHLQH